MRSYYLSIIFLLFLSFQAAAQCIPAVEPPIVNCGTAQPLADNVVINTGQTYGYTGPGATFNNITINGGTLLICGTATINNVNFNSGRIIMTDIAVATFNGSFNTSSSNIFINYGSTTFNTGLNVQGSGSYFLNFAGATLTVNGTLFFNSSIFNNNGTAYCQDIVMNGGATVCLGPNCYVNTNSIQNNTDNPVTVPNGIACISYNTTFTGNNPITTDPDLHVCQESTATPPNPVVVGQATITQNCTDCQTLLPLKLTSFKGNIHDNRLVLEWETASEENVREFIIEHSSDGSVYRPVGNVAARNRPSSYQFTSPEYGGGYYRLKMTDLDGRFSYSPVIRVRTAPDRLELTILSNPVAGPRAGISIVSARNQAGDLVLTDNMGRIVRKMPVTLSRGSNSLYLAVDHLAKGQYLLHFISRQEKSQTAILIRQ